jgi:hypothetical protein
VIFAGVRGPMQPDAPRHITQKSQRILAPMLANLKFIIFASVVMLLALHAIERSGLPGPWAFTAAICLLFVLTAALVIMDRTSDEASFMLNRTLISALGGGALIGTLLATMLPLLLRPMNAAEAIAVLAGSVMGVAASHVIARILARPGHGLLHGFLNNGLLNSRIAPASHTILILLGLLICIPAVLVGYTALPVAVREIMVLTGWSGQSALIFVVFLLLGGLVLGGGRTLLAGLAALAAIIGAALVLLLGEGLYTFGALPLPGPSSEATLNAIAEARGRWIAPAAQPPLIAQWPSFQAVFTGLALNALVMALVLSAFVTRSLSPAVPIRRKTAAWSAIAALVCVTLAGVAIGGYAIEAAGSQLVGASLDRAPQRVLDAAASDLIRICGAAPLTLEALRANCAVTGRGVVLSIDNISLEPRFLWSGLPQALGLSNTNSAVPRSLPAVLALITLLWSVWAVALGLGRGMLAHRHLGPGQASQRLAFVRVAGALFICALAAFTDVSAAMPDRQIWLLAGAAGFLALLLDFGLQRRSALQVDAHGPALAQAPPKTRKPRTKSAATKQPGQKSPDSEAAQL